MRPPHFKLLCHTPGLLGGAWPLSMFFFSWRRLEVRPACVGFLSTEYLHGLNKGGRRGKHIHIHMLLGRMSSSRGEPSRAKVRERWKEGEGSRRRVGGWGQEAKRRLFTARFQPAVAQRVPTDLSLSSLPPLSLFISLRSSLQNGVVNYMFVLDAKSQNGGQM